MSTLIDALKKTLDAMETCSEPEVICYAEEIRGIIAEHERSEMIDYRESLQRLVDSIYGHFVPSAICKARDAAKELLAEHERSGDWLPIGSCPDDGETEVLLWQDGLGSAEIGTYDTVEFYRRNGMAFVDTPTHWQPLPKGPQP